MNIKLNWLGAVLLLLAAMAASIFLVLAGFFDGRSSTPANLSYEQLTGSVFLAAPQDPFRAPRVRELTLPAFAHATSIWGATGRDTRGHIWIGVSASSPGKSAHLLEYDPNADAGYDRGSVIDKLREVSLFSEGEGQVKIHSRIVPGADGWLYFASTDEEGENAALEAPPRWGGHLWRIHPERHTWQHLFAARDGLVAVSGAGRYVYALGYWGHILYQYDTETGRAKRLVVGSAGGHVSRNFLSDLRGHAYVPRLTGASAGAVSVHLVEFDPSLKEVAATPLEFYLDGGSPESNHGIVGLAYLPDGRMLFSTHMGYLYVIDPRPNERAAVRPLGWLHPGGETYAPSLFSLGGGLVAGAARRPTGFEWVVYNLETRVSSSFPLELGSLRKVLLYGSIARDNAGRLYLGGWTENEKSPGRQRPLALQIDPGA